MTQRMKCAGKSKTIKCKLRLDKMNEGDFDY